MADITMCYGNGCKVRGECYRFVAKTNPFWQSYAAFYEGNNFSPERGCDEHINVRTRSMLKRVEAQVGE